MGQALKFCQDCGNKRGCDDCQDLHEWIMERLEAEGKPKTNGGRIRAMTDKQLADWLCGVMTADSCDSLCPGREMCMPGHKGLIDWLLAPAEEE